MLTRFLRSGLRPQLRCLSQQTPHIEEEYFEDFESQVATKDPEDVVVKGFSTSDDLDFVGNVVGALTKQRAKDLFVVRSEEKEMTPYSHRIICSVFNSRQAAAISENLRSILKIDGNTVSNGILSHVKKSTKRSNGWYVSEIDRVQIHVMSEECREKYDLEAIWAGDDRILEEIDELKQKTLLPPQRR
ncbi:hypothetical protein GCK72_008244 [Caenorhabditis remanei]|uniref:Ribosomal silencing factor RsfS n=1 Tax=Caenorhabditis remanei TaxID=31234 RepID=A0A6A5GZ78_CAERE|nr:hypothetical protein GCK72_008244 [Caenorhabditis remanei]KAF1759999.1 hypothetical protein GCK72_008244 [Caenorhabditis remanei]